jgi:CheY-like chemotaxis protein
LTERLYTNGSQFPAAAARQHIGSTIELTARRKDGSEFPVEIMLSPLESVDGILVTAAIRDISVRKDGRWKMKPTAVQGGEEALAELFAARETGNPYRLLLTDMHMPDMDGFGLVDRIRQKQELSTDIIMMFNSVVRPGDAERRQQLQVAGYLLKPIRQSELCQAITRILGTRQQEVPLPLITSSSAQGSRAPTASLRVLVAEDNPVNQLLLVRLLEKRGHHIQVVVNRLAALQGEREI